MSWWFPSLNRPKSFDRLHGAFVGLQGDYNQHRVNHSAGEYVRHYVPHINGIESVWALFKRQIVRTHHLLSPKHLNAYHGEMTWRSNLRTIGEDDRVNALLAQTAGRLTLQDAQGTTDKGEKPLGLDMPFSKALERFIGVDPEQLPDRVKLPQKRGRRSDPRCCEKKLRLSAKRRESAPERVRHVQSECDNTRRCRA